LDHPAKILDEIERASTLEEVKERLKKAYGAKYSKAEELINSSSVKKYVFLPSGRIVWIVVGKEKEYFVIPRLYCQCDDFYINVVVRKKADFCYHMIAQLVADKTGAYESYEVPDSDFIRLNCEWKKQSV